MKKIAFGYFSLVAQNMIPDKREANEVSSKMVLLSCAEEREENPLLWAKRTAGKVLGGQSDCTTQDERLERLGAHRAFQICRQHPKIWGMFKGFGGLIRSLHRTRKRPWSHWPQGKTRHWGEAKISSRTEAALITPNKTSEQTSKPSSCLQVIWLNSRGKLKYIFHHENCPDMMQTDLVNKDIKLLWV